MEDDEDDDEDDEVDSELLVGVHAARHSTSMQTNNTERTNFFIAFLLNSDRYSIAQVLLFVKV